MNARNYNNYSNVSSVYLEVNKQLVSLLNLPAAMLYFLFPLFLNVIVQRHEIVCASRWISINLVTQ